MIMKMYAVRDAKAGAFLSPFFARQDAEAMRMLRTTVNDPSTSMHIYHEDYHLFYVGEYDDSTGLLDPAIKPLPLCSATELLDPMSGWHSRMLGDETVNRVANGEDKGENANG